MCFKIFLSGRWVSSNPGVSRRTRRRPLSSGWSGMGSMIIGKGCLVQEVVLPETSVTSSPRAMLMNYEQRNAWMTGLLLLSGQAHRAFSSAGWTHDANTRVRKGGISDSEDMDTYGKTMSFGPNFISFLPMSECGWLRWILWCEITKFQYIGSYRRRNFDEASSEWLLRGPRPRRIRVCK